MEVSTACVSRWMREYRTRSIQYDLLEVIDHPQVVPTAVLAQLIGIVIVAEPALPAGKRFCRAIRNAVASPPEA